MSALKAPLGRSGSGSSSSKRKRQKFEGELRDTESQLNHKHQELEAAQEELSDIQKEIRERMKDIRGWDEDIRSFSQFLKRSITGEAELSETEEKKIKEERQMAREERKEAEEEIDKAKEERDKEEKKVHLLEKEVELLQEKWSTTKRLVIQRVPDITEYFRAIRSLCAPPDLVSHHVWWEAQRINPLFLCFVPPEAQPPMPLELVEEVFSRFLVDAKEGVVDECDCTFTYKLCCLVGQELENEREMADKFRGMVTDYLGGGLSLLVGTVQCASPQFTTDGCVMSFNHMALLTELKLDPKTTLFQAMQYYAVHLANLKEEEMEASFWPCFLIELVGTCIRISGLVYFQKVACQPLTPFMHCYINDVDRSDMNNLCRAMRALRTGVHKLCNPDSAAVMTRNKNIPYRLCLPGWEFQRRIADKLLFVIKELESGVLRLIKFSRLYGESIHKAWADKGLAPQLINCNKRPDGWYVIEMEYLNPDEWKSVHEWSNRSQTSISKRKLLQGTISNALSRAHGIHVNGSKTMHGDMRSPNIMVKERDEGGRASFEVKFVDFDWSGTVENTLYPTFMNMALKWHPDVKPGEPLRQEHDAHMLDSLLGDVEMNV